MTYEPRHSARAQSVRVYFWYVGQHYRDITRREDKCTFYPISESSPSFWAIGQYTAR